MRDLEQAKALLNGEKYTCALIKGEKVVTSKERGVKPLLDWYENGENFSGFSAADKVVGRATAFLYALLGVRAVYARVLSVAAEEVLRRYGIFFEKGKSTENIVNRRGDGICPFEEATLKIEEKEEAYAAIKALSESLERKKALS